MGYWLREIVEIDFNSEVLWVDLVTSPHTCHDGMPHNDFSGLVLDLGGDVPRVNKIPRSIVDLLLVVRILVRFLGVVSWCRKDFFLEQTTSTL